MRRPQAQSVRSVHLPAPMGGLNTIDAAGAMPPTDCVSAYNLIAAEMGLRSRLGWREWCTGLTGLTDNLVRAVLPFTGSTKNGSQNRLFATTATGIWDVSASSAAPTQVLAFATQTGDAGYGVCHTVVTAGGHFLLYTDEENGLHVYTESTGLWAAVTQGAGGTQIDGVDPADLVFVTVFKSRVWLVERDTARAWYLDAGSVYGTATPFELGTKFRAGGPLVGLWSWTGDGGAGIDDSLVAVSGGGDVAIYQGTDPASASTFGLRGCWYLGAPPEGRNIGSNFGGDLLLLSRVGVIPLSRLLAGGELERGQYATAKVQNLFNRLMLSAATLKGWSLRLHPEDNALLVTAPTADGQPTEQLAMALANRSWWRYRDLPIYSSEAWGGKLYFGTVDGRVCINDGYVDGVLLSDANAYTPVQWALLGAFHNLGVGNQKQVQMVRPTILSEAGAPAYEAQARYRYDLMEIATVTGGTTTGSTWDSARWDVDVWGGDYQAAQRMTGAVGMGTEVALAVRGTAQARTVYVGSDVLFTLGGLL